MATYDPVSNPRKRKRRRRFDKPAINARLILDDHVKGDIGIVSEDAFRELFPQSHANNGIEVHADASEICYVGIAPRAPFESVEDISWTVVPVIASSALASSTIQFSPSSLALQSFAEALQRTSPSRLLASSRSGIEILALDVVPLPLATVFVTLESDLARRLENGEGTFHKERNQVNGHRSSREGTKSAEDKLSAAVRQALASLKVVHVGDLFTLPLPPHPITHVLPPPAKVTLCEPVAQGLLRPETRIILTRTHHTTRPARRAQSSSLTHSISAINEADEDTSNEQFFSAAEDRYKTDAPLETDETTTGTETELSEEDQDDLSDDSMEDVISLPAPLLSASTASGVSTIQPGTPHALGLGRSTNGINTPGSVFSSFTATTVRAGGPKGRLFRAQALLSPMLEGLLRPAPMGDEDEEARLYVDIASLTKIGCFSGDWVHLETAAEPPASGGGLWSLGSFGQSSADDDTTWRPVKVYSLPDSFSSRAVTKIPTNRSTGRRMSFFESQITKPTSPTVFLSPLLLANLDHTPYVRLSALKRTPQIGKPAQPRIVSTSLPAVAREVTLVKISTPLSTERALQTASLTGLKKYFATRTRVVKTGDLLAIPVDELLNRALHQPVASKEDLVSEEILVSSESASRKRGRAVGVFWFKVGHIVTGRGEELEEDVWGGVASIDASLTQMIQSGTEKARLPATMNSSWPSYLGLREVSRTADTATSGMLEMKPLRATPLQRRLRELVAAATNPRAIHLRLQPLAVLLVSTQRNIGKVTVAHQACSDIGLHSFTIDAYDVLSEGAAGGGDVKTEGFLKARAERAMSCGAEYTALVIRHIEALTADRMIAALKDILATTRVLIATTTEVDKIPDGARGLFTHEMEMNAPDEWEREGVLQNVVKEHGAALASDVDLSAVAVKTAALVAGDLVDVVERAVVARRTRLEALATNAVTVDLPVTLRDVQISGGVTGNCLVKADFDLAVDAARKNFADAIGAPKIPNVGWDDVGGLTNVKDAVMETIQLPLERPELFAKGMKKRSGILFYGPPGTGKTLLAKAIATEFSLNFFSVKGPELLNMYIGESEANVRRVFQRARDARPCVVFFDELDSVAPKRGNQGDSGGVMDRIVSQLLAELDGMSDGDDSGGGVFVIGATNRPDLLDAALLRPGRFDKMLYLGVSDTHDKQTTIMEALTRKFTLAPLLSLSRVADTLPFTYTGADFYALCSDAMLKAVTRQALAVDAKIAKHNSRLARGGRPLTTAQFFDHYATKADIAVMVTEEDFLTAQRELVPSVSAKELEHYRRVREQFESVDQMSEDDIKVNGNGNGNGGATTNGIGIGGKGKGVLESHGTVAIPSRPRSNGRTKSQGKDVKGKGKGKATLDDVEEDEADDREHEEDGMSPYRPTLGSRRSGSAPVYAGMGNRGNDDGSPRRAGSFRDSLDDDADLY